MMPNLDCPECGGIYTVELTVHRGWGLVAHCTTCHKHFDVEIRLTLNREDR